MTTVNEWPFDSAESEFAALLAKMTSEQRAAMRARIEGGKIEGSVYYDEDTGCGCVYGTYYIVTDRKDEIDIFTHDVYAPIYIAPEVWGTDSGTYTLLEGKVWNIDLGQTPADNPASAWLIAQMDAFEKLAAD